MASHGFTLVELLVVIMVVSVLLVAGAVALRGTPAQARKTSMDTLQSAVEQARTHAITRRAHAVLAMVNPGEVPGGDSSQQRIGLFEVTDWPEGNPADITALDVLPVGRWQSLDSGVVMIAGSPRGTPLPNPLDTPEMTLRIDAGESPRELRARVMVFHPRGGLRLPSGSEPMVLRLAEGGIREGEAIPIRRDGKISESTLRVGRVMARSYRND